MHLKYRKQVHASHASTRGRRCACRVRMCTSNVQCECVREQARDRRTSRRWVCSRTTSMWSARRNTAASPRRSGSSICATRSSGSSPTSSFSYDASFSFWYECLPLRLLTCVMFLLTWRFCWLIISMFFSCSFAHFYLFNSFLYLHIHSNLCYTCSNFS